MSGMDQLLSTAFDVLTTEAKGEFLIMSFKRTSLYMLLGLSKYLRSLEIW